MKFWTGVLDLVLAKCVNIGVSEISQVVKHIPTSLKKIYDFLLLYATMCASPSPRWDGGKEQGRSDRTKKPPHGGFVTQLCARAPAPRTHRAAVSVGEGGAERRCPREAASQIVVV